MYLGMELLNHTVTLHFSFVKLFRKAAAPSYNPTSSVCGLQRLHILTNTLYYVFLITVILMGVKWYLTWF